MSDDTPPIWKRYRDLLRRRTPDEVADELRFHLEMRTAEARRAGLSEPDALAAAHERFGNFAPVEAELLRLNRARDTRRDRSEWLAGARQDVVFAIRGLRRAPGFAATAIATLAIAIGANTAIYSVVHALLVAPLPYGNPEQLATPRGWGYSNGELLALRRQLRSASDVAAYGGLGANLDDGASAERLDAATVSANFFSLLHAKPLLGRTFANDENDPGKTNLIVISEGLWRRRFGGDSSVIGRRVLIDGSPMTVVGVMPAAFAFPSAATTFWKPYVIDRASGVSLWASAGHSFIVRLRPGVTLDAARRELKTIAVSLRHANTIWDPGPAYGKDADLSPLQEAIVGGTRPTLLLLLACAALVLLIACANVANLLLARATGRERELAVRAALGGGRGRLIRQLLSESLVVSAAGGLLGLLLAGVGLRWIVSALPSGIPRQSEITMNAAALGFTAALAILTGLAFGVLPAFRATNAQTNGDVVRSGRTGHGVGHQRVSAMLVVGEVALAVLLAIGAELLVKSFSELRSVDPGFQTTHIISARLTPAPAGYTSGARVNEFYDAVLSRMAALPGVESVGAIGTLPLAKPSYGMGARIEGQFEDFKHVLPTIDHMETVTPGYLRTVGMHLVAGRELTDADRAGGEPVALVSQSMAKRFWPASSAIGKRIGYPYQSPWITIVGVVGDIRTDSLRDTTAIAAYVPFAQRLDAFGSQIAMTLVARTSGDPAAMAQTIRTLVAGVDRTVPVSDIQTMDDVMSRAVAKPRFTTMLVGAFALVALLLGAVGIYGVMSYVVSQRAQELSVRAALGATSRDILVMVVMRAGLLAGTGALLGMAGAIAAARPLRAVLYGVSAVDPAAYAAIAALFVGVAVMASAAPARRASRADPASALRAD